MAEKKPKYTSVSSVTSFTGGPPANWYAKVEREAYEKLRTDFQEGKVEVLPPHLGDANDIMNHSKWVGRIFHGSVRSELDPTFDVTTDPEYVEAVSLLGGPGSAGVLEAAECLRRWQQWWQAPTGHIETEKVLESDELMLTGRCDCLVRGENAKNGILYDWKTSDKCYTSDYLEVAAYAGLLAKQGIVVATANIIRIPKDSDSGLQVISLTTEQLVLGWGIFKVLLNAKRSFDEYEKILKGGGSK